MPVEIRELIIRTTVVNGAGQSSGANGQGGYEGNDTIIAACVDQVLKILERKRER
ncbi:MAG: DUF5908 family protein [Leptolyngbyaceae cyanobacterium MO_188.B28]|nr:DUF5908 family protein [Leptolyngbyaceae cyanobacterium MO_188.B28]